MEPELRIGRRRKLRFDLRQMLQPRTPVLLARAVLGEAQIQP